MKCKLCDGLHGIINIYTTLCYIRNITRASLHMIVPPSPLAKKPPRKDKAMIYQQQSRKSGHHVKARTPFEKIAHIPITKRTLKTAEPTMVPKPTALEGTLKVPMNDVASSGADPPAAMRVAPATSGLTYKQKETPA